MIDKNFTIPLCIHTKAQLADLRGKLLAAEEYNVMLLMCLSKLLVEGSVQELHVTRVTI